MTTETFEVTKVDDCNGRDFTYLYLKDPGADGVQPFILTEPILLTHFDAGDATLTLPIESTQSFNLHDTVLKMETKLSNTLKILSPEHQSKLPYHCQKVMTGLVNNLFGEELVRPNYFSGGQYPVMYLKGNYKSMQMLDFDNRKITVADLGPGHYQFLIRCHMVYMGTHKNPAHISNLQLRITQLRFKPLSEPNPSSAVPIPTLITTTATPTTTTTTSKPKGRPKKTPIRLFPSEDIQPCSSSNSSYNTMRKGHHHNHGGDIECDSTSHNWLTNSQSGPGF